MSVGKGLGVVQARAPEHLCPVWGQEGHATGGVPLEVEPEMGILVQMIFSRFIEM